ncbi:hypothetical protein ACEPPN_017088 [Leptodophora sp. 'Broadleaf-Isolate-01']
MARRYPSHRAELSQMAITHHLFTKPNGPDRLDPNGSHFDKQAFDESWDRGVRSTASHYPRNNATGTSATEPRNKYSVKCHQHNAFLAFCGPGGKFAKSLCKRYSDNLAIRSKPSGDGQRWMWVELAPAHSLVRWWQHSEDTLPNLDKFAKEYFESQDPVTQLPVTSTNDRLGVAARSQPIQSTGCRPVKLETDGERDADEFLSQFESDYKSLSTPPPPHTHSSQARGVSRKCSRDESDVEAKIEDGTPPKRRKL